MDNIINVPMAAQRDLPTVTAEIRTLQWQGQKIVVEIAVEIGRRLCEAKSMVNHGEWGSYLKEELGFSQSTANAHMQLFREYGADQITLFGATAKSQALGNLGYTKALKLLALPSEEREEFVEKHDVDAMSTRELEQAIRKLKAETERADAAEDELCAKQEELAKAERRAKEAEQGKLAAEEREKLAEAREQAAKESRDAAHEAMQQEKEKLTAEMEAAKAQFDAARAAEQKAKDKLKKLKDNPQVPQEVLDKLKAEARAEAEEAAAKQTEAAKAEREKLEEQAAEARRSAKEAAEKLAQVRKQLALASPALVEFKTRYAAAQEAVNALLAAARKVRETDKDAGEKCARALGALCDAIRKAGETA